LVLFVKPTYSTNFKDTYALYRNGFCRCHRELTQNVTANFASISCRLPLVEVD